MKVVAILLLALCGVIQPASAGPIWSVKPIGQSANNVYSFYIDGDNLNGTFDTIFFQAKATSGTFTNNNSGAVAGVPRPAGDPFTYPNRMITADPLDFPGGLALTQVGLVNNAQELSYTAGKLGGTISTGAEVNGDLFLGNIKLSGPYANFSWQMQLITGGVVMYDTGILTTFFPPDPDPDVPEPASLSLAMLGFAGSLAVRRRCRPATTTLHRSLA
ncbi:MAG: PEP-CTERM sorting domain-containing protein [Planctomycetaceae bacterium]|nr:PEP-CTERM sorting domain-containing protein [Planctomycetaceae bacterium]